MSNDNRGGTLHNFNSLKRPNIPKCVCIHQQRAQKNKAKIGRTKGRIDKFTVILNDLKTTLPVADTTSRSIISKDMGDWTNVTKQLNLLIFMEHYPQTGEHILFSCTLGISVSSTIFWTMFGS